MYSRSRDPLSKGKIWRRVVRGPERVLYLRVCTASQFYESIGSKRPCFATTLTVAAAGLGFNV